MQEIRPMSMLEFTPEEAALHTTEVQDVRLELRGWPYALIKAVGDPFQYGIRLRTGEQFEFEYAVPEGEGAAWVSLHGVRTLGEHRLEVPPCPRGLCVRVADIVWVADAPFGS